ncbi:MAG: hypothetical protein AAFV19_15615 [Pseudomonadota bacterium]
MLGALKELKAYGRTPTDNHDDGPGRYADHVRALARAIKTWEDSCPNEVKHRGWYLDKLKNDVDLLRLELGLNSADPVQRDHMHINKTRHEMRLLPEGPEDRGKPVNRWHKTKDRLNMAMGVAGAGNSGLQTATGNPGTAGAIGAGVTGTALGASGLGIGLLVVGAALTVGGIYLANKSRNKTKVHIRNLEMIAAQRDHFTNICHCTRLQTGNVDDNVRRWSKHMVIFDEVLPYLIKQKKKKKSRKGMKMIPLMPLETARSGLRGAWKMWKGTKGVRRQHMSYILAEHFLTHDCLLTQAIIADLYSPEEMEWMKWQDFDTVHALLYRKFKST